jgi:hypothetical protein
MPTPFESATLLLTLYDQRREETMRKARDFVLFWDPLSFEDIQVVLMGPQSGYFRMVTTYWDMAASFVAKGAIDPVMFDAATGEYLTVFGKIEPFLVELREMFQNPNYMKNLEDVCRAAPGGGIERVVKGRERLRQMLAMRAAAAPKP